MHRFEEPVELKNLLTVGRWMVAASGVLRF